MRTLTLSALVFLMACNNSKINISVNKNDSIISFLKNRFHIHIDTAKIDITHKWNLTEEHQNFSQDSLIWSQTQVNEYPALDLLFIKYYNYFGIKDSTHETEFSVNVIQDKKNGKFYIDYINDAASMYVDGYFCSWNALNNIISPKDTQTLISKSNLKSYNSIKSNRTYGEFEFKTQYRKKGIEQYLNSNFQDTIPDRKLLDSLFVEYDKYFYHRRDTLLNSRNELYDFMTIQATRLRALPDYGDREQFLYYLKSQIGLIVIQTLEYPRQNLLYWIYKDNTQLRVRKLLISGNKTSTYSYTLEEYEMCF